MKSLPPAAIPPASASPAPAGSAKPATSPVHTPAATPTTPSASITPGTSTPAPGSAKPATAPSQGPAAKPATPSSPPDKTKVRIKEVAPDPDRVFEELGRDPVKLRGHVQQWTKQIERRLKVKQKRQESAKKARDAKAKPKWPSERTIRRRRQLAKKSSAT